MSVELVAIGDLHFDKPNLNIFEDVLALQLKAIDRVLDASRMLGIQHVLFLGDISHHEGRLSEQARVGFLRLLHRYQQFFNIYVILGNHDYAEKGVHSLLTFLEMDKLKMLPKVRFFSEPEIVNIEGIPFHFLPFPYRDPVDDKPGVCVAHFEVNGAVRDNGSKVKSNEQYCTSHPYIQGHLHTYQKIGNHLYAGTLYQTSFGERQPKGYLRLLASREGNGIRLRHKFVRVDPEFHLVNLIVNSIDDLELDSKPNTRFKLFVHEGVEIPPDYLQLHPEIVNRLSFSTSRELEALELEEFVVEDQSTVLSHSDILPRFLRKKGLSKRQIRKALAAVNSINGD